MHNMSPLRSTTVALDPHFTTSPGLSQPLSTSLSWCSVCQFTLYWGHFVSGNFLKCPMAVLHRGPAPHCNYSICLHSAFSTSHTHLSLSLSFLRYLPLIPRTVFPPLSWFLSLCIPFFSVSKEWIQYIIGVGCSVSAGGPAWDRWGLVAATHPTGALWCQWGGRVFS